MGVSTVIKIFFYGSFQDFFKNGRIVIWLLYTSKYDFLFSGNHLCFKRTHRILISGDEEQEGDQKLNLAPTCIALAIFVVLVALCSNLIAFLLFYKKPVFRKILSNR